MRRIQALLRLLDAENLDGIIVSSCANVSYLCGFCASDAYLLVSRKETVYFTDSRYTEEVRGKLKGIAVLKKINGSVFSLIAQSVRDLGLNRIAFEERYIPYAEFKKIKEYLKGSAYLIPSHSLIEGLRQIKDSHELKFIREAVRITALSLNFLQGLIKPGMTELEVAAEVSRFMRYNGATNEAFDTIIASGPNSAFPHHRPTSRRLKSGDPVLVDMGITYSGYKSDLTRVFFLGKINDLTRRVYEIVLKAQARAIAKIKPGETAGKIDSLSRKYIAGKGYAEFFGHSLGHGVGLETHESPSISGKNEVILRPGMVFTVEPAIYLPGKFGIRIEDMVLVTKKGCEVLSGSINK